MGDEDAMRAGQSSGPYSFALLAIRVYAPARFSDRNAPRQMSGKGRVSRTHRLSATVRNCTRDEGGPFEVGSQVQVSSHRELLSSRAMVVSVAETSGLIPAGTVERGERKRTADEVSRAD